MRGPLKCLWDKWRNRCFAGPDTGRWGEDTAAKWLKTRGYKILGHRVRVGRRDELDLVARLGEVLVFIEVKTRASDTFGRPIEAVNRAKRAHLSRAAVRYLKRLNKRPDYFRFDVVEVIGGPDGGNPEIRHVENAFNLDRRYQVPH